MKKTVALIIFIFSIVLLQGQTNLVPNWSFEIDSLCPDASSEINYAPPWHSAGGNPDYFNTCVSIFGVGIPLNWCGYQYPKTGIAYAGIYCYVSNGSFNDLKEYLHVKLSDSLVQNRKYCVSFYVNLSKPPYMTYNNVAITEIGMYFSDSTLFSVNAGPLPFTPQIVSPTGVFLTDTVNWTEISGTYIAYGGEKYITIGNFKPTGMTDTMGIVHHNNTSASYYFIDDVTVRDCTNDGVEEIGNPYAISVNPNPNNGNFILDYHIANADSGLLSIYDVTGKLILSYPFNSSGTSIKIENAQLNAGAYFYQVKVNDRKVKMGKLIIVK